MAARARRSTRRDDNNSNATHDNDNNTNAPPTKTRRVRTARLRSESDFAICLLLEIPLRDLSFHLIVYEKCRTPNNDTDIMSQRLLLEKEIPSGGSQAGDMYYVSNVFV